MNYTIFHRFKTKIAAVVLALLLFSSFLISPQNITAQIIPSVSPEISGFIPSEIPTDIPADTPTPAPTYTISGVVYVDVNANAVQDEDDLIYNEPVTLTLNNSQTATTDTNGNYVFESLPQGNYTVTIQTPNPYVVTTYETVSVSIGPDTTVNFGIATEPFSVNVSPGDILTMFDSGNFKVLSKTDTDKIHVVKDTNILYYDSLYEQPHLLRIWAGTNISKADGSHFNPGLLTAGIPAFDTLTNYGENKYVAGALYFGIAGEELQFSNPVEIDFRTPAPLSIDTLSIVRSINGADNWTNSGIVDYRTTCDVYYYDGTCFSEVTRTGYYAALSNHPLIFPTPTETITPTPTPTEEPTPIPVYTTYLPYSGQDFCIKENYNESYTESGLSDGVEPSYWPLNFIKVKYTTEGATEGQKRLALVHEDWYDVDFINTTNLEYGNFEADSALYDLEFCKYGSIILVHNNNNNETFTYPVASLPFHQYDDRTGYSAIVIDGNHSLDPEYLAYLNTIATPTPTYTPTPTFTPTPTPVPTYNVTGNVYVDTNYNGVKDASETNYPGAAVSLTGTVTESATADTGGNYTFNSVVEGVYDVAVTLPAGYIKTTTNPVSIQVTENTTVNFGIAVAPTNTPTPTYTPTPTINPNATFIVSGYVFKDTNKNGVKDAGEAGYANASIEDRLNGVRVGAKLTNSSGFYSFPTAKYGTHTYTLAVPGAYTKTTTNPVTITVDSNKTINFGMTLAPTPTPKRR